MKEFLISNWQWIACLVVGTIELFFVIFKKSTKVNTIREKILDLLPVCISLAEEFIGAGNGSTKKSFALDLVKKLLKLDDSNDAFISSAIESILSTPEKKSGERN